MKITEFITEAKVLVETRTSNQILLELNVINIPQIDTFIADIAQNLPSKETQKWFTSRAKKYLINSEEDNAVITHFSGKAEPWMKQRQKEGVQMYRFNPSHDLSAKLAHVVDWVRAMNDTTTGAKASDQQSIARAKKAIKGLNNTSITQAIELSNQWVRDMNAGKDSSYKRAEDETGLVPVMAYGEFKWYKLTDQDCLDREGKVMGHCVASYGSDVISGKTVIYSLRDNNNFAHATVEVKNGELEQVKGKRNAPPVEKYRRATVALLNTLNVPPSRYGRSDIEAMDYLYNSANNKYGTIKDVGVKVHEEGKISVWSFGGNDATNNISVRILAGDQVVCNIGPDRYTNGLRYQVKDLELMKGVEVKGAKYNDPAYKLAKFITQVVPQSTNDVDLDDKLSKYMQVTEGGILQMYEDIGELVYADSEDELRFGAESNEFDKPAHAHVSKGELIGFLNFNDNEKNIGGRATISGNGWRGMATKSKPLISKYVNSLKQKDRPIIQDASVFQNPKTFEASDRIADTGEAVAVSKSGNIGWYKVIDSSESQNSDRRRRRFNVDDLESDTDNKPKIQYKYLLMVGPQIVINIDVDENGKNTDFTIYHADTFDTLSQADIEEVASLFNKSGLNKYYPFTNGIIVSKFEENGMYFLREKRMFTTDHSIAGEQFQHDDKEFKAIKTHNHLKIYYKDSEVVVFDLTGSNPPTVKEFRLKNKLAMLNNVRKIADVLNHYEILRGEKGGYGLGYDVNPKIAQAGLTYSADNGWKGMKSGPKPVENTQGLTTSTIGKNEYEIFSFKRDFLIQDAETHELIATLKGVKDAGDPILYINQVKMESQRETAYDMVADALNDLSQKADIRVKLNTGNFSNFKSNAEKINFNEKMNARGYIGSSFSGWGEIAEKFPSEVISKGAGGTWVKEAFTDGIDTAIRVAQTSADESEESYRGREKQTPEQKAILKYNKYSVGLDGLNYTLYSRKTPVLRAFVKRDMLQAVYIATDANTDANKGEMQANIIHDKETLLRYGNAIGRLLQKLNIGGGQYLTDNKIYIVKGKLQDITKNPKLAGFTSGEIVYEDGHKWKQNNRRWSKEFWELTMTTDDGKEVNLIKAKVTTQGLESISFDDPKVRKHTKLYRPFLNDIMDIVDQLYGSD